MAQVAIRRGNEGGLRQPESGLQRGPFGALRSLMDWDPFGELAPLVGLEPVVGYSPAFDVKETSNAFVFKADLPGFAEKDLQVSVAGERLMISGARHEEREDQKDTSYICERRYGSFSRAFTLPQGADIEHVNAELKQGVLTLTVPRIAATEKKIPVKTIAVKA